MFQITDALVVAVDNANLLIMWWLGELEQALVGFGDEEVGTVVAGAGAVDADKAHRGIGSQ